MDAQADQSSLVGHAASHDWSRSISFIFLQENYGKPDEEKVQRVKKLYNDLDLEKAFQDFEESSYTEILSLIDAYHGKLPKDLFIAFTNKIYKRAK